VRFEPVLELEHYLDVLERKPGALAGSTPFLGGHPKPAINRHLKTGN
jgi:hypothetical protein